jgi:hypothetical protein
MAVLSPTTTGQVPRPDNLTPVSTLFQRVLEEEDLGVTGTATGGATDSLIDTTLLKSSLYPAEDYEGAWVRISETGDGAAPMGEIRQIKEFIPEEGTIKVTPFFSVAPDSGDTYQIWFQPHPQKVLNMLNNILKYDTVFPHMCMLTDLPDGDMEDSTAIPTYWNADGVGIDGSNSGKLAVRDSGLRFEGRRYLKQVLNSGQTTGYHESETMGCQPGQNMHISALVMTNDHASAQAKLSLWDKTNDQEIKSVTVTRQLHIVRLFIENVTMPETCRSFTVRLYNMQESGQTGPVLWDSVLTFVYGEREIRLPAWVQEDDDIRAVFEWVDAANFNTIDRVNPGLQGDITNDWEPFVDAFSDGYAILRSRNRVTTRPMYVLGARHEEAITNDTTLITNVDYVRAALTHQLYEHLAGYGNSGLNVALMLAKAKEWEDKERKARIRMYESIESSIPAQGLHAPANIYPSGNKPGVRFVRSVV